MPVTGPFTAPNGPNWPSDANMGPKRAKTRPRWPHMTPNGPKLGRKVPVCEGLLATKFGPPIPRWRWSVAALLLKTAPQRTTRAQKGAKSVPNGPKSPQMAPNLGQRFPYVRPPYPQGLGPPTPRWHRSAAVVLLKKAHAALARSNSSKQQEGGP